MFSLLWLCIALGAARGRLTREMVLTKEVIEPTNPPARLEEVVLSSNDTDRDSRGLLKKLGFLAGLKTGGLISSSGTLAASNSVRIFGKVMNTALSVSYGHVDDLDPLPEVQHDEKEERETSTKPPFANIRKNFIKHHNAQVSRVNHKFLRSDVTGRNT